MYLCSFLFMERSLWHRPSFPPSPPRTPPSYALHRRKQPILSFPVHSRMPAFFVFLAFAWMMSRVVSPPQRKQVIGRFSFRLRQDLQYALSPCLCCVRVMHESFVAAYCFPCCGMYHRHSNLLEIEIGCCTIIIPASNPFRLLKIL